MAKAEERLASLVDPAITELASLLRDNFSAIRLATVKDILDRAGFKPQQRVDVTSQGEQVKAYVGVDLERV